MIRQIAQTEQPLVLTVAEGQENVASPILGSSIISIRGIQAVLIILKRLVKMTGVIV